VMGGMCFRARTSHYKVMTLEDTVIFVHDMENCLMKLDEPALKLLALIALMEYSHEEAAEILHMTDRHVRRMYPETLDLLTSILASVRILRLPKSLVWLEEDAVPKKKPCGSVNLEFKASTAEVNR
jgi:hypothetical protein